MDVLNLKLVMTVSFVLFKSQYILDFFNRCNQKPKGYICYRPFCKEEGRNQSKFQNIYLYYCFFIKVLFTYEYTLQNVRLRLSRLMNNFAESIYKKQKL